MASVENYDPGGDRYDRGPVDTAPGPNAGRSQTDYYPPTFDPTFDYAAAYNAYASGAPPPAGSVAATQGGSTGAASGGPQGGDFQSWFMGLTGGKPPTPASLVAMESELNKYGVQVKRNAAGTAGKIQLPDGRIIDVILAAGEGGKGWQWLDTSQGGGGGGAGMGNVDVSAGGFTTPPAHYSSDPWAGQLPNVPKPDALQAPYVAPTFTAPGPADMVNDPGYETRMAAGQRVLENAAAARGSILSGGTQKALARYGQEYGANEYQNVYNRALGTFQTNTAAQLAGRQQNVGEYGQDVNVAQQGFQNQYQMWLGQNQQSLSDYMTNLNAQRGFQQDYWSRLRDLYSGGQNAATGSYKPVTATG
jgi:hypothetical protein